MHYEVWKIHTTFTTCMLLCCRILQWNEGLTACPAHCNPRKAWLTLSLTRHHARTYLPMVHLETWSNHYSISLS